MPKPIEYHDSYAQAAQLGHGQRRLRNRSSGPWHSIGDPGEPAFQNGWTNAGGTAVVARFRWSLNGGTDLQASMTGGTHGTVAFTLPPAYRPDADIKAPASDDDGNYIVLQVKANGDVIPGIA